ncbi:MAG: hypothetical protein ACJ8H8_27065 [Geminicoccaceae bacterium]
MITRRTLLMGSALGAGVVFAARSASALTLEDVPPRSGLGLSLSNRCGGDAEHAQIAASLRAQLGAQGAAPGTVATATCPVCGCPVVVSSDG